MCLQMYEVLWVIKSIKVHFLPPKALPHDSLFTKGLFTYARIHHRFYEIIKILFGHIMIELEI